MSGFTRFTTGEIGCTAAARGLANEHRRRREIIVGGAGNACRESEAESHIARRPTITVDRQKIGGAARSDKRGRAGRVTATVIIPGDQRQRIHRRARVDGQHGIEVAPAGSHSTRTGGRRGPFVPNRLGRNGPVGRLARLSRGGRRQGSGRGRRPRERSRRREMIVGWRCNRRRAEREGERDRSRRIRDAVQRNLIRRPAGHRKARAPGRRGVHWVERRHARPRINAHARRGHAARGRQRQRTGARRDPRPPDRGAGRTPRVARLTRLRTRIARGSRRVGCSPI